MKKLLYVLPIFLLTIKFSISQSTLPSQILEIGSDSLPIAFSNSDGDTLFVFGSGQVTHLIQDIEYCKVVKEDVKDLESQLKLMGDVNVNLDQQNSNLRTVILNKDSSIKELNSLVIIGHKEVEKQKVLYKKENKKFKLTGVAGIVLLVVSVFLP